MTSKEKKQYLSRYKKLDNEIDRKLEECQKWHDKAEKITPTISDMPKSNSGSNKIESAVERIIDLENELNEKIDCLVALRRNIESDISSVEDDTLRTLLEYRYIDGMTWEEVAVKMNFNYRWVLRLHGRALTKLAIESHI